jgi:hypothetical protein
VPAVDHEGWAFVIIVAKKGSDSTWDGIPNRANLRTGAEQARWLAGIERFAASNRPSHFETSHPAIPPPPGYLTATFSSAGSRHKPAPSYSHVLQQPNEWSQ